MGCCCFCCSPELERSQPPKLLLLLTTTTTATATMMTTTTTTTKLLLHIKSGNSLTWKLLRICCVFLRQAATGAADTGATIITRATCNVQRALATCNNHILFSVKCSLLLLFAGLLATPTHRNKDTHTLSRTHTVSHTHTRATLPAY